ncbi:TRAP transporter substrate-binding protein [Niallia endozanthoxylica]|uniref:TRAP transporter substrate-binding protein n=1 Tax=Niallia endozanthoxylica TaxID=2036016 RepID=A0A5J5H0Q8_9BACI|nr:TRAP transporter substrate-binding protein [Niallia endozanthoxylica]KAA9013244.1 TRAP transporter substrate-binding protein [Niallia endozanthoxylica]
MKTKLTEKFSLMYLFGFIVIIGSMIFVPKLMVLLLNVKVEDVDNDTLAYTGAILGGFLTLIGVYLTIKHSDQSFQRSYNKELEKEFIQDFPQKIEAIEKVKNLTGIFLNKFKTAIKDPKEVDKCKALKHIKDHYSIKIRTEAARLDGHIYVEVEYLLEQLDHVYNFLLNKDLEEYKKEILEKSTDAFDNIHRSIEFFTDYQESLEDQFTCFTKDKNIWATNPMLNRLIQQKRKLREKLLEKFGLFRKDIQLTIGHNQTDEKNPYHLGLKAFEEVIENASKGIHVEIITGDTISDEVKLLSKLQRGKIDMIVVSPDVVSRKYLFEELEFLALPYLFDSYEHWEKAVDGKVGKYVSSLIKKESNNKLHVLGYFSAGIRHFYGKRHINRPEDLAGMTVRTQTRGVMAKYISSLNAYTNSAPWGEVKKGLDDKTIDFAENAYPYFVQQNHHSSNHGKYITETGHSYTTRFLLMNGEKFSSLTRKQRRVIMKAAKAAAKVEIQAVKEQEEKIREEIKGTVEIRTINDIDLQSFKMKAAEIGETLEKKNYETKKMIKKIKKLRTNHNHSSAAIQLLEVDFR